MAGRKSDGKGGGNSRKGFSPEERAAMKERVREMKAAATAAEGEAEVLAKIATMAPADRTLAGRVHAFIKATAPNLTSRTWYGMPAYYKDGELLCHFQESGKFGVRYSTIGFSDEAKLDDGRMWPIAFALTELTATEQTRIAALLKRAMG